MKTLSAMFFYFAIVVAAPLVGLPLLVLGFKVVIDASPGQDHENAVNGVVRTWVVCILSLILWGSVALRVGWL